MPDVTYSPTQGRQSSVSAEERLAQDQRDFLFRSQLAAQQQANEQRRMAMAGDAQSSAERMQAAALANNLDVNGDFGARTGAARDLVGEQGRQAQALEGVRGKTTLDAARIGAEPGMAAIGIERRKYNDQRNDRLNDPNVIMGNMVAKALGGGAPDAPTASRSSALAGVGQTTNGTLPGNHPQDASDNSTTNSESFVTPTQGASPMPQRANGFDKGALRGGGMMPGTFGPSGKTYQFDDKSARDQQEMLDQLRGQIQPQMVNGKPRAGWREAQDQLDHSNMQLGERKAAIEAAKSALMQASVPSGGSRLQALGPNGEAMPSAAPAGPVKNPMQDAAMRKFFGENPEDAQARGNRQELMKAALASDDPATKAEGVKMTLDSTYKPDPSKMFPQSPLAAMGKTTAAYEAFKGSPQYQTALSQLNQLAQQGDESSGAQARQVIEGIIQQAAGMGAAADSVRNDLTMALDQARPREGGVFAGAPWRNSTQFRQAAGLYQPDLMTPQ